MINLLNLKLNTGQLQAVEKTTGPTLILSGAGSGKTQTIAVRFLNLVHNHHVDAKHILMLTFSRKAVSELKTRIFNLHNAENLDVDMDKLHIYTFNAFGSRLIQQYGNKLGFYKPSLVDKTEREAIVNRYLIEMEQFHTLKPNKVLAAIDLHKVGKKTIADKYRLALEHYQDQLRKQNKIDFNDQINLTIDLLSENRDILRRISKRFKYIMVDEFQDTSVIQYKLLKLLTSYHKNIAVVGDDDQAIYGWRGADIENINRFLSDYSEVATINLPTNYRCSENILNAASNVIQMNTKRQAKQTNTPNAKGDVIRIYHADDVSAEARKIAEFISLLDKYKRGEMAILFRGNKQIGIFKEVFTELNIEYEISSKSSRNLRSEFVALLHYLNVFDTADDRSLEWILKSNGASVDDIISIYEQKRNYEDMTAKESELRSSGFESLSQPTENETIDLFDPEIIEAELREPQLPTDGKRTSLKMSLYEIIENELLTIPQLVKDCFDDIKAIRQKFDGVSDVSIIETLLGTNLIQGLLSSNPAENKIQQGNLLRFLHEAKELNEPTLKKIKNLLKLKQGQQEKPDKVQLMTIHNSKGLEFDVVFIAGCEDGTLPAKNALEAGSLDEERRLFYVAMTRARKKLFFTVSAKRNSYLMDYKTEDSRFISDIKDEYKHEINERPQTSKMNVIEGKVNDYFKKRA